jgi:hypothetical protein
MGRRGPEPTSAQELYSFAQLFYWDLRSLAEGYSRTWFDKKRYEEKWCELDESQSGPGVRTGEQDTQGVTQGSTSDDADDDIRQIRQWEKDQERHLFAWDEATIQKRIPGEPDVLKDLLEAETPERIRKICKDAFVVGRREVRAGDFRDVRLANWPISNGSTFPHYLALHAEQFLAAKRDPRFPRSNRPSNQLKQLWFLSRALAGALFNVSTRTAINLVGSLRPEQLFEDSGAAKPIRTRKR